MSPGRGGFRERRGDEAEGVEVDPSRDGAVS